MKNMIPTNSGLISKVLKVEEDGEVGVQKVMLKIIYPRVEYSFR